MADEADIANELIEERLAREETRARKAAAPEFDMNFDGVHCVECGSSVEAARLALKKVRCIECQRDFEKVRWAFNMRPREYDEE